MEMEDCNMLAADCIVISCCCQCLILQIIIFVFLKLPYKLVWKTKYYAMKKLRSSQQKMDRRRRHKNEFEFGVAGEPMRNTNQLVGLHDSSECCMEQVEKVLEELSLKGEFAFGSFWGRRDQSELLSAHVAKQQFDASVLDYQYWIQMLGSLS